MLRLLSISILLALFSLSATYGQVLPREVEIKGDRLSGVVLPVLPRATDIAIVGLRANAWTVDDTKRLIVEKGVVIKIGAYTFDANQAVIWINRMETDAGIVSQIACYLPSFAKTSKHGGLGASGENLLVVGSTLGRLTMDVALLTPKKPTNQTSLITRAETRLANYVNKLVSSPPALSVVPQITATPNEALEEELNKIEAPFETRPRPWLHPKTGAVSIAANKVELNPGEVENVVTLDGDVHLELQSTSGIDDMQMSAARAIIFLDPGSVRDMVSGRVDMSDIHGVYLEGNVVIHANKGDYLIRAPQMYYDFDTSKAVMVESVLRTYAGKKGKVPLYVRAKEMQQVSNNQWVAKSARVSTSTFATPDLAIGSSNLTITQEEDGNSYIQSKHNTVRFGGVPVFYWPYYAGKAQQIPIHRLNYGYKKTMGSFIETEWDLFTLMGVPEPSGIAVDLRLDGYKKRGGGIGFDIKHRTKNSEGKLDLYFLSDAGEQKTSSGREMFVPEHQRGYALWSHEAKLNPYWNIQSQFSYISDPTFTSVWRQKDFKSRREYETSIYAKYQKDNTAFTALGKYDINKFISTNWLLASRPYKVDKMPELGYYNYATSLFDDTVTWSSETNLMRERMVFQPGTPNEDGLKNRAFLLPDGTAIGRNDPISDVLTARGLDESIRNRFVTRHEFTMPLEFANINFTPFASIQGNWGFGNDDSIVAPTESDYWVRTIGFRATSQFQRIYNSVDNDLLDLHRMRHVIEPYLTAWNGDSNIDPMTIQQYDARIDNISTGSAVWCGVKNKLQTWRGGPGRWYEVDWLTIDTALLFASNDATQRYDQPHFYNWRPEYSSLKDAAILHATWQYSDSIAFIGSGSWNLDDGVMTRGSIGAELDHSKDFKTSLEYREIDNTNDQFLSLGINYKLSNRYSFDVKPMWNFDDDTLQTLSISATRHYPDFDISAQMSKNEIQDETTYGLRFKLLKF